MKTQIINGQIKAAAWLGSNVTKGLAKTACREARYRMGEARSAWHKKDLATAAGAVLPVTTALWYSLAARLVK